LDQVIYRCGNCQLDAANRRFTRDGRELPLEPKVFATLVQLLMRPGDLLTRDELLDAVWGHRFVTASTLNRVIAVARRAFADDADGRRFIQTVHGAGYRYVGPIETSVVVPLESRARFGPPPNARLPARLQGLIGREDELARMKTLLADARALTVLGTGGMGKTQCALAFAHAHVEEYPDGVWFFDLAPLQQPVEWLQTLALALSIAPSGEREMLGKIAQALAQRRSLLLLDNCDRLSSGVGGLVVEILQATEQLKVLATSQQQLNFVGERILRMPPLRLPGNKRPSGQAELAEFAAAPAISLLLTRIRDSQPEFVLSTANAPAIVDICARLDGMPLALELAAARFALLAPDQVLERLDQRFRFLVSDRAGRDRRHRNLVTLLDWSFKLLSPEEQRFLAWLGVFVQGWSVDAAIELASAFGETAERTVDLLTGLANKSLVSVDQSVSPPRYRLLESVREFALEQLATLGEERRARDAHLACVLRMTEAAHKDMLEGRMRERIALLAQEHGNIDSASEYAVHVANDRLAALRIAGLLMLYVKAHGAAVLGKRLCERALADAPPTRTRERAMALMCRGVNEVMGEKVAPESTLLEAVSVASEVGDDWTAAYSSGFLALWLVHCGRTTEAIVHCRTLEVAAEQRSDEILHSLAGFVRGWVYLAEEDMHKALAAMRPVDRLGDDYHQHHFTDMYIALALFRMGEYGAAAGRWYEAMRSALVVGHMRGVSGSIEGCAYIAERTGRLDEACRFLGAAEQIRERAESPLFSFWIRHNESANAALRSALGMHQYEAAMSAGARMRQEDVVNEAAALLRELGAGAGENSGRVITTAKRLEPSGVLTPK
jgi:predicted ATPase/DNA-binding winged helix-turn-helix (wHTH) protein